MVRKSIIAIAACISITSSGLAAERGSRQPNILFAIADDASWPHFAPMVASSSIRRRSIASPATESFSITASRPRPSANLAGMPAHGPLSVAGGRSGRPLWRLFRQIQGLS